MLMWFLCSRFPQYNLPTFKVAQSGCLKKVRVGEEISLVRLAKDKSSLQSMIFLQILVGFSL
jgi:hypothetical protein